MRSWALVRTHHLSKASEGLNAKLAPKYTGPYTVVSSCPRMWYASNYGALGQRVSRIFRSTGPEERSTSPDDLPCNPQNMRDQDHQKENTTAEQSTPGVQARKRQSQLTEINDNRQLLTMSQARPPALPKLG